MMKAVNTSEMSVEFYKITWRNNPEYGHCHTYHSENLKISANPPLFVFMQTNFVFKSF
jgi:hypothetical protein